MSNKTQHTPKPWEYACMGTDSIKIYQEMNLGRDIAEINDGYDKEDEANARLIAASPELLEALKEASRELQTTLNCLECSDSFRDLLNQTISIAERAIAKAEGRGK